MRLVCTVMVMATLGTKEFQYQSLRFRTDHSLWGDAGLAFRLQFFHVGRGFAQPVHLYEVIEGKAREILARQLAGVGVKFGLEG